MSSFPEWKLAAYVDGELSPAEVREVEAELVRSRRARELVVALREEAGLLGDALQEREREAPQPAVAEAPARGMALGLPAAVALVAVLTVVLSFLLEARLPAGIDWLNPLRILGAYEMLFDLIFLLRNSAPGFFELCVALAATGSLAALATFAASAVLRRFAGPALLSLGLISLALAAPPASAVELRMRESVHVTEDQTVEGTLIVTGDFLRVDGVVRGDVFAFVEQLTVRGKIEGNLFSVAKDLELSGETVGSAYLGAENLNVSGRTRGNLYTASDFLTLAPEARVDLDSFHLGERIRIEGEVSRDVVAGGKLVEIRGSVGRDLETWARRAKIFPSARIAGDVVAHVHEESDLEVSEGALVGGETSIEGLDSVRHRRLARYTHAAFYFWLLIRLCAAFVTGLLLYALLPGIFGGRIASGGEFFRSLGVGFVALLVTPIALVIVGLTLVGLPIALIGLALYASALYLAGIAVAALIGVSLVHPGSDGLRDFGVALLVGVLIVTVATHIPILGVMVRIVVILVGLGVLTERARHLLPASREEAARA
jgi:cytoskeletal protein CcmA (bactofilin family)/anti-sigma factor RsiW